MINLLKDVKSGVRILCIGDNTPVKSYPLGLGHVYCRSFQSMDPLPEQVDTIVFMHEPSTETRLKIEALVQGSKNPRVFDAWKDK